MPHLSREEKKSLYKALRKRCGAVCSRQRPREERTRQAGPTGQTVRILEPAEAKGKAKRGSVLSISRSIQLDASTGPEGRRKDSGGRQKEKTEAIQTAAV